MNLKQIREARAMSRNDLAKAVGVSVFTVRNWEQGQREPDIAHLKALARTLHVTVDELVGMSEAFGGDAP
nr:helix-turn-helix transcriptional regulator [Oscillospiraceae bacterium]